MAGLHEFAGFVNNYGVGAVLALLLAVLIVQMVQPVSSLRRPARPQ